MADIPWRPLRRLLAAWARVRRLEPSSEALGLDPDLPTVYVLPRPALSDRLLLEHLTGRDGLPPADTRHALDGHHAPALLTLPDPRRRRRGSDALRRLIDTGQDVQLVPVSVFWGRAPGKRFGLWQLLAADDWRLTGRLRRLLAVLVNGRDLEVQLGAPLRLSDLADGRDPVVIERKAARLLRVHFRRVRERVLGPDLSHRRTLIAGVVASPEVERTIDDQADGDGTRRPRLRRRAHRYGREIAANMSYPVLRFLDGLLGRLWHRLYDGIDLRGLERIKALAGRHTLVYVPCHRSHIDYLLLSYVLYEQGLMPPHIAAGRNLNMPLVGPLLRRGGAFFLRRSFRGQPLYARVFDEYLHRLLSRGHSLEYFIEGGRSRSGRLLSPRPGMLAMTLSSFLRGPTSGRPLSFVPVYIGYERILEEASYEREMAGGAKRRESPLALLGVLGRLREPYGRVTVNVGEPLALDAFLDAHQPDWREAIGDPRPAWRDRAVSRLGRTLARRINAAATLNPVNLVALGLLATPYRAIEAELLERQLALLAELRRPRPGDEGRRLPTGTPRDWIDHARSLGLLDCRPQPLGDLVTADERQTARLGWYRNNVLHLYALTGLVAFAFRHHAHHRQESLERLLAPGWPILVHEFSIAPPASFGEAMGATLDQLVQAGLLVEESHGWRRAEGLAEAEQLRMLGRLMRPSLERGYLLVAALLGEASGHFGREGLAGHARQLAERLARLTGRAAPEFFDARLFDGLVESLEQEGWLSIRDARLHYDRGLREAARRSRTLFDPALRHRLERIAARRDDVTEEH
ncbi:glycerol-3-phosphate 1-O-acyltransferase PlsB [Halomonas borealis]|uniref:glycerol-3-phosphate 1-O-acyltransferase PlsB n=1 Tax=Halomonas borealis TaxID=2508710 RepID=UPI0010A048FD|nr:glycerol-3-phosphate 1-O-acyltransferase PlsB [Halomonas borealis]